MATIVLEDSDEVLMSRVQNGDPDAFGQLYERHSAKAFSVALSVCRDTHLAEQALQEGFLSIWRGRSTFSPQNGSFRGWATTTVRNRAIDQQRRLSTRPQASSVAVEDLPAASSRSALDEAMERSDHKALDDHLGRLPETQAEVITLAYFGGMTHTEIAEELDLPAGTVKGRMRLGLEKLRRDLTRGDSD